MASVDLAQKKAQLTESLLPFQLSEQSQGPLKSGTLRTSGRVCIVKVAAEAGIAAVPGGVVGFEVETALASRNLEPVDCCQELRSGIGDLFGSAAVHYVSGKPLGDSWLLTPLDTEKMPLEGVRIRPVLLGEQALQGRSLATAGDIARAACAGSDSTMNERVEQALGEAAGREEVLSRDDWTRVKDLKPVVEEGMTAEMLRSAVIQEINIMTAMPEVKGFKLVPCSDGIILMPKFSFRTSQDKKEQVQGIQLRSQDLVLLGREKVVHARNLLQVLFLKERPFGLLHFKEKGRPFWRDGTDLSIADWRMALQLVSAHDLQMKLIPVMEVTSLDDLEPQALQQWLLARREAQLLRLAKTAGKRQVFFEIKIIGDNCIIFMKAQPDEKAVRSSKSLKLSRPLGVIKIPVSLFEDAGAKSSCRLARKLLAQACVFNNRAFSRLWDFAGIDNWLY